jgi:hypothetical protein
MSATPVLVALGRPAGYEDVYAELVVQDAMRPGWSYTMLRDDQSAVIIAVDRPDGYERAAARDVGKDAVQPYWRSWAVIGE